MNTTTKVSLSDNGKSGKKKLPIVIHKPRQNFVMLNKNLLVRAEKEGIELLELVDGWGNVYRAELGKILERATEVKRSWGVTELCVFLCWFEKYEYRFSSRGAILCRVA